MAGGAQEDRERQMSDPAGRAQRSEARSTSAARSLISAATTDSRMRRREELEREVRRLHRERRRLEREHGFAASPFVAADVDRHLSDIEQQLRALIAERHNRMHDSGAGPAGGRDDSPDRGRWKRETERLTAELLRCADALSAGGSKSNPRLRRIWHMLRLCGS